MMANTRGRRRTATLSALLAASMLTLAACGSGETVGTTPAGERASTATPRIAAVIKGLDNPFFQTMKQGMDDQASTAKVPVTVQAANAITDTTGQADKLNGLAGQDFSCYVINPISGTNLVQGLAHLSARNRTVINVDSPIDAEAAKSANVKLASYIGTDNVEAGKMAGQRMTKLLPDGGKVAAIGGIPGDVTSGARIEGFQQGLGPDAKVAQIVAANWERQTALTAATDVLRAHPDLAGFFVANDDMGLGVARAVANAGKTGKVKVISVDGIKDALNAVKAGTLDGTVAQYPYAMGLMAVEACQAAAIGKTLPVNVKAPVELVTKENADEALAATPKPFGGFDDPFMTLIK